MRTQPKDIGRYFVDHKCKLRQVAHLYNGITAGINISDAVLIPFAGLHGFAFLAQKDAIKANVKFVD